jgi:hypothetical protein
MAAIRRMKRRTSSWSWARSLLTNSFGKLSLIDTIAPLNSAYLRVIYNIIFIRVNIRIHYVKDHK